MMVDLLFDEGLMAAAGIPRSGWMWLLEFVWYSSTRGVLCVWHSVSPFPQVILVQYSTISTGLAVGWHSVGSGFVVDWYCVSTELVPH